RDILMAYCLEKGYRCFDGIKALTASVGSEEEIKSLYSGHLTKRGNRLFAKSLYSFLESEKLLPADLTQKPTA
ncbi:MAG: hypothetical protein KDD62_11350, partial [Bdellovibrionales bacterium]|nr:hypothetical protein [Bdellovibrionales bacterium]